MLGRRRRSASSPSAEAMLARKVNRAPLSGHTNSSPRCTQAEDRVCAPGVHSETDYKKASMCVLYRQSAFKTSRNGYHCTTQGSTVPFYLLLLASEHQVLGQSLY